MKDAILIELAERWKREARETATPEATDIYESASEKIANALEEGRRIAKRDCADDLLILVRLLGGEE